MTHDYSPSIPQYSPPASEQSPRSTTADETRKELREAIQGSNQILVSARTVLALFPDTVTIDRAKVTVTKRQFFRMAEVVSVRIEDVLNATCTLAPFFGTVGIVSRVMNENQTITIGSFWRADAKRIKRILQGYVIALQRDIDCAALGTRELATMLERLGADNHPGA
jgi:hypothetical protein